MRVSSRAVTAGQRVRERPVARRAPPPVWARSPAPGIFLWTRTAIWAAALFAFFTFVPNRHPLAGRWDDPSLTLAAFTLAERRRYLGAGVAAGLALLTRPTGIALLPALALLAWRERDRLRALASLAVSLIMFAAYPLYLWQAEGDPWAFLHAQRIWNRHLSPAGPLGGIWDGLRSGWAGVEQLASGSHTHRYWTEVQNSDPIRVATLNLENLAFLALFIALTVIAWRRFGAPYG